MYFRDSYPENLRHPSCLSSVIIKPDPKLSGTILLLPCLYGALFLNMIKRSIDNLYSPYKHGSSSIVPDNFGSGLIITLLKHCLLYTSDAADE